MYLRVTYGKPIFVNLLANQFKKRGLWRQGEGSSSVKFVSGSVGCWINDYFTFIIIKKRKRKNKFSLFNFQFHQHHNWYMFSHAHFTSLSSTKCVVCKDIYYIFFLTKHSICRDVNQDKLFIYFFLRKLPGKKKKTHTFYNERYTSEICVNNVLKFNIFFYFSFTTLSCVTFFFVI